MDLKSGPGNPEKKRQVKKHGALSAIDFNDKPPEPLFQVVLQAPF